MIWEHDYEEKLQEEIELDIPRERMDLVKDEPSVFDVINVFPLGQSSRVSEILTCTTQECLVVFAVKQGTQADSESSEGPLFHS